MDRDRSKRVYVRLTDIQKKPKFIKKLPPSAKHEEETCEIPWQQEVPELRRHEDSMCLPYELVPRPRFIHKNSSSSPIPRPNFEKRRVISKVEFQIGDSLVRTGSPLLTERTLKMQALSRRFKLTRETLVSEVSQVVESLVAGQRPPVKLKMSYLERNHDRVKQAID